jgi:hypothetical protein
LAEEDPDTHAQELDALKIEVRDVLLTRENSAKDWLIEPAPESDDEAKEI